MHGLQKWTQIIYGGHTCFHQIVHQSQSRLLGRFGMILVTSRREILENLSIAWCEQPWDWGLHMIAHDCTIWISLRQANLQQPCTSQAWSCWLCQTKDAHACQFVVWIKKTIQQRMRMHVSLSFASNIFNFSNIWWLVGGIPTPLKNMSSSAGIIIPNKWKIIRFMFQTSSRLT